MIIIPAGIFKIQLLFVQHNDNLQMNNFWHKHYFTQHVESLSKILELLV